MPKNTPDKDVTWGDNVIYAEFGKPRKGSAASRKSRGSDTGHSAAVTELKSLASWSDSGTNALDNRRHRRAVQPRTAFAQWVWEFICRGADAGRISRGEKYYAQGHVLSTRIGDGFVVGEVKGSQLEPFSVFIRFPRRGSDAVEEVLQWLVDNPGKIDSFERGELPFSQMEKLICDSEEHLYCECSCPDPAAVCKHTIAVGARFVADIDARPLSLMELRGVQPNHVRRRLQELVESATAQRRKKLSLNDIAQHAAKARRKIDSVTQHEGHDSHDGNASTELHAVAADFWGKDLPRVEVPELPDINPLKITDQSLLHDALLPTCVISRETLRAVSDLEDCWNHLKESDSISDKR